MIKNVLVTGGSGGIGSAIVDELFKIGKENIRINSISPGTVVTEATEKEPKDFTELLKGTAINSFATKEEIAKTVKFVLETHGITGQNIIVDSGQSSI